MRLVWGLSIFFFGLLLGPFCVWRAQKHLKDPGKVFYLGNVAPSGRKYVWGAFVAWLLVLIGTIVG